MKEMKQKRQMLPSPLNCKSERRIGSCGQRFSSKIRSLLNRYAEQEFDGENITGQQCEIKTLMQGRLVNVNGRWIAEQNQRWQRGLSAGALTTTSAVGEYAATTT